MRCSQASVIAGKSSCDGRAVGDFIDGSTHDVVGQIVLRQAERWNRTWKEPSNSTSCSVRANITCLCGGEELVILITFGALMDAQSKLQGLLLLLVENGRLQLNLEDFDLLSHLLLWRLLFQPTQHRCQGQARELFCPRQTNGNGDLNTDVHSFTKERDTSSNIWFASGLVKIVAYLAFLWAVLIHEEVSIADVSADVQEVRSFILHEWSTSSLLLCYFFFMGGTMCRTGRW